MVLQIDNKEWILLQDLCTGLVNIHSTAELHAMRDKLNKIFIEQCHGQKEEHTDVNEASGSRT